MEFRIGTHQVTGKPMVEVWENSEFIAGICGHENGLKIASKYLDGVTHESGTPPSVIVNFSPEDEGGSGG